MFCTVTKNLEILSGTLADYDALSRYHYREHRLGPYCAIYAIRGRFRSSENLQTVGVIVYAMPTTGCKMRSLALSNLLDGLDKHSRMVIINKNLRTISRVIIEPRFRSLGLAARLVKETMPLMNTPFIEALAVMGQVNPFFEKAGMTRYDSPVSAERARLIEAFAAAGIDEPDLIDPASVQRKLSDLSDGSNRSDFIEREMVRFLQSYGRRRLMPPGLDRTKFVLSKLTDSPVYYLWKNPNLELRI